MRTKRIPPVNTRPMVMDTLVYLMFSSGTSGLPKGNLIFCNFLAMLSTQSNGNDFAWISHGNIIFSISQAMIISKVTSEVHIVCCIINTDFIISASLYSPPSENHGHPSSLPLHHTGGLHLYALRSFLAPSTQVLMPKWDMNVALKAILKYAYLRCLE